MPRTDPVSPARRVAFEVLTRVEGGGHSGDELRARGEGLSSRDAGLATELVMGVLRFQGQLDYLIEHFSGRPAEALDMQVRLILRLGLYQIRYLDRIPPHAAIHQSVEIAKQSHKRSAAGLVNAVLRKVHLRPVDWPDLSVAFSHPEWLLERWEDQYGSETMAGIVEANMAPPHTFIRVPPGRTPPEGADVTPVKGCWLVDSAQEAGGFRVQDIGSQSVVPLLDLQPGQRFLDLCAAPGNKTAQALEAGVRAVAADQHRVRLMQLTDLGVPLVRLDARRPLPFGRVFDRILVDAPCTGTGTLSRNPEIKWRLRPEDLPELQARQAAILKHALDALAPGGRLVYATCSLEPEENDQVVALYKDRIVRILRRIPGRDLGDGFFAAAIQGTTC
ncbi:MAG: hypothetical protein IPM24_06785 [Bryobacterales bacterium]|nr:hypothetical protein [Bryobacterales bacterium]